MITYISLWWRDTELDETNLGLLHPVWSSSTYTSCLLIHNKPLNKFCVLYSPSEKKETLGNFYNVSEHNWECVSKYDWEVKKILNGTCNLHVVHGLLKIERSTWRHMKKNHLIVILIQMWKPRMSRSLPEFLNDSDISEITGCGRTRVNDLHYSINTKWGKNIRVLGDNL